MSYNRNYNFEAGFYIAMFFVWLAAAYGYVANVIKLIYMATNHSPIDAMFILRGIGIVATPLGAVLGYF